MKNYKVIGIDLAKTKFHLAALDTDQKIVLKKAISRTDFFNQLEKQFPAPQTFAFEACSGSHYTAQRLQALGHEVILLKPKDVKAYARSRQKNDINDAIAICKAALDPNLMRVKPKLKVQQEVCYLHKARQNAIQQRIQRSNSLMNSLQEFGYIAVCGKARFVKEAFSHVADALSQGFITEAVHKEMILDCEEMSRLITREKELEKEIIAKNQGSKEATLLETIPGIGPINASVLGNKSMEGYASAKDFAASLGLVPKQCTTGGIIQLGSITKQGDRYARTMLIQAGRSIVMRTFKPNVPNDRLYQWVEKLKKTGKKFNVICVAVANKLARIAYACATKQTDYVKYST
jgi:transposase